MEEKQENKKCFECGVIKSITEFYKNSSMSGGRVNKCKSCTRASVEARRLIKMQDPEWAFKEAERHRLKAIKQRESGYKSPNAKTTKRADYKKRATTASMRLPCPEGKERHHWNYNKEYWKCVFNVDVKFHNKIHRYTKYDPDMKMYRTVHGTLLDSRELASKYYRKLNDIQDGEYSELTKLF